jgi:hypothetical protein
VISSICTIFLPLRSWYGQDIWDIIIINVLRLLFCLPTTNYFRKIKGTKNQHIPLIFSITWPIVVWCENYQVGFDLKKNTAFASNNSICGSIPNFIVDFHIVLLTQGIKEECGQNIC